MLTIAEAIYLLFCILRVNIYVFYKIWW